MASTHKHLRSSAANKRPTASGLSEGQIALNTNSASPGLFFKDSTGASILKVGPTHVGTVAPNASPAAGGSAGNGIGESWLDTSLTPVGDKVWDGTAWVNTTPASSTTVQGLVELATNAETQTGSDAARAVTPASLQSKVSDSTSTTSSTTIASSTAVKSAYDLANAALPVTGGTITGAVVVGSTGSIAFEGSTDDAFETTLAVVDPTADRTITLPDRTGTVITTGDTGTVTSTMIADGTIVNADINASAAIAGSKISPDFAGQNVVTTGSITGGSLIPGSATVPTNGLYLPAANSVAISTDSLQRLVIDSSGRLLVGASNARATPASISAFARLQLEGSDNNLSAFSITNTTNGAAGRSANIRTARIRGTSVVAADDVLGQWSGWGYDGSDFVEGAQIKAEVDGTPGANDMPGRIVLSTTADGASSPTERMRIDSAGLTTFYNNVVVNTSGGGIINISSSSLADLERVYAGASVGGQLGHVGVYKHSGISNPTGFLRVECEDGTAGIIWVDNSDVVRVSSSMANVGTTGGTVVGSQTSDERLKNILGPIEYGLETVKQLAPVRYVLKDDPSVEKLGFIAQQTQPVVPEAVYDTKEQIEGEPENAPNKLAMEYVTLVPVLVNAIKELSAEVDAIKVKVAALEAV